MGLGSTTKKIQLLAERAEQLYAQIGELREQINELRTTVEATGRTVDDLERRSEKQWALLVAIAEAQDVDVEQVLTEAAIEDLEVETEATEDDSGTEDEVIEEATSDTPSES